MELITTGNELLNGRTVNQHASALARALAPLGLRLTRDCTVPDDPVAIRDALTSALNRSDIVMISGGLGPTSDDVTRDVVATFLGRGVKADPDATQRIKQRCCARGVTDTQMAERQALIIDGSTPLPNSVGAAPGELIEFNDKVIFLMPGPPREFGTILSDHIIPWLRRRQPNRKFVEMIWQVAGMPESEIAQILERSSFPPSGVNVAYCASPGSVEICLTADSLNKKALDVAAERLRELLGDNIYNVGRSSIEEVVGRLLRERGASLASAESCTGGLVGHHLTNISGSSDYYLGGIIAYANDAKVKLLGVDPTVLKQHGAVSAEIAEEMAKGARERFGATYGIGITGIAGPTGGTADKPVGLVYIAVSDCANTQAKRYIFSTDRVWFKEWCSQTALDLLRRWLLGIV